VLLTGANGAAQKGLVGCRPKDRAYAPVVVSGREPHLRWVPVAELTPRKREAGDAVLERYLDSRECQKLLVPRGERARLSRPSAKPKGSRPKQANPNGARAKTPAPGADLVAEKFQLALLKVLPRIDGYKPGQAPAKNEPTQKTRPSPPRQKRSPKDALSRRCPRCGARAGVRCDTPSGMHKERKQAPPKKKSKAKSRSVWTVSGGGFETNRRRH
jgi:hypothetical protein